MRPTAGVMETSVGATLPTETNCEADGLCGPVVVAVTVMFRNALSANTWEAELADAGRVSVQLSPQATFHPVTDRVPRSVAEKLTVYVLPSFTLVPPDSTTRGGATLTTQVVVPVPKSSSRTWAVT